MQIAWFCILQIQSKWDLTVVPNAVIAYLRASLTLPAGIFLRVVSAAQVVPAEVLMRASCTLAVTSAF